MLSVLGYDCCVIGASIMQTHRKRRWKTHLLMVLLFFCAFASISQSHSQPVEVDDYDKRLIAVVCQKTNTDAIYSGIAQGLHFLPNSLKSFFIARGVTVVIMDSAEQTGSSEDRCFYDPAKKRVVIGINCDKTRLPITTLHELGHAYDQLLGYPARQDDFQQAYSKDAPHVPQEFRVKLSHFLQPGIHGPRECFASLFACKYYRGTDPRLTALKASFPTAFSFVDNLNETVFQ